MVYTSVTMSDDIEARAQERRKQEEKECEKNVTVVSVMLYSVSHVSYSFNLSLQL